jgi:hypothetical protein
MEREDQCESDRIVNAMSKNLFEQGSYIPRKLVSPV